MAFRLYVGNLPYTTDDQALGGIFRQFGRVLSSKVVVDRETGLSRGFGFVEMASEVELAQATEMLDGREFEGHYLNLLEAKDRPEETHRPGNPVQDEPSLASLARRLGQRTRR